MLLVLLQAASEGQGLVRPPHQRLRQSNRALLCRRHVRLAHARVRGRPQRRHQHLPGLRGAGSPCCAGNSPAWGGDLPAATGAAPRRAHGCMQRSRPTVVHESELPTLQMNEAAV